MIIGVTGTTKVGKSTLIGDFMEKFDRYQLPEGSYRDIDGLDLYENGTEESQRLIRDYMFKQAKDIWAKRDTNRRVIHDRTLLDNLACTMYLFSRGKVSSDFFLESLEITKKAMSYYHIIYFVPITKVDKIKVPSDIDVEFRECVDLNLKTLYNSYTNRDSLSDDVFPLKNCTAIEEVCGSREIRMQFVSLILDENGDLHGGDMPTADGTIKPPLYSPSGQEIGGTIELRDTSDPTYTIESFGFTHDEVENPHLSRDAEKPKLEI